MVVAIAVANKLARIIWTMMTTVEFYRPNAAGKLLRRQATSMMETGGAGIVNRSGIAGGSNS